MLYRLGKNVPCFVEIVARIKQAIDFRVVARPFLDFVEVSRIGDQGVFGLLVGPIVRRRQASVGEPICGDRYSARAAALPCGCSRTAAPLLEEACFDFRINLVEPLLCALCSVPVPLDFSL